MEELQIKVSNTLGTITTNFEEIENNLREKLAEYKGIIVTEDTLKESKKDISTLRKVIKDIEDSRKEIKKAWNVPYTEFESKCKYLESLVEEPINEINNQVAVFEQKKINEKKEHLEKLYEENIEECSDYISFESSLSDKWKNVSYVDKDYLFDLSEKKVRIKTDLTAINALNSEIEDKLLAAYKDSGNNLAVAIQKNSDYLAAKAAAEKKIREEVKEEVREELKEEPKQIFVDTETGEIIPDFTFRVSGNENIQKVKDFLDFSEIPYVEV